MLCLTKRNICLLIFFTSCIGITLPLFSQQTTSESKLPNHNKISPSDTVLLDTYLELVWPIYSYDEPDSSLFYGEKSIQLANELNDLKRLSIAHRRIGITYTNIGDIKKSLMHQQLSYDIAEKINYRRGMQLALNNIGVAYLNNEILNTALSYFLRSLKLAEEAGDASGIEQVYYNCAVIYRNLENLAKSNENLLKAISVAKQKSDSTMLLVCYCGLSTGKRVQGETDSAFFYLSIAKNYLNELRSTSSKFGYYLNEGLLYSVSGNHKKALELFLYSQKFANIYSDAITVLINIAEEFKKLGQTSQALKYYTLAYDQSFKNKAYSNLSFVSAAIANIYKAKGDYKNFADYIQRHINYRDSNEKYNRVQQIQKQQLEFEFQRRLVADSLLFSHKEHLKDLELEMTEAKLNKEKTFSIMLAILSLCILLFLLFIFNRLKVTRAQKITIEKQKQLVELKNHEIIDSINYAKRLQSAILPQVKDIQKDWKLDILYLPKDIIGGDFYFYEKRSGFSFFAVCDCTGHGIPGALMSVVCHNALHKAIFEFELTQPGIILDKCREIIIDHLNAKHQNIQDGMDCSLIVYNHQDKSMQWAGANNNLWLYQDNELSELKADKQPVAFYENEKAFQSQHVPVKKESILYLLSDGYGDQFGGPLGKKFKNKNLKLFLSEICREKENKQVELLKEKLQRWQGELDQVDDITIAVIKFQGS